jgi:hypothetical protein
MKLFIVFIIIIILFILYLFFKRKQNKDEDFTYTQFIESTPETFYLMTVNQYSFPSFQKEIFSSYTSLYSSTKNWKNSIEQSIIKFYQKYFNTSIIPVEFTTIISSIQQFQPDLSQDVYNWIILSFTPYKEPIIPSTYQFYSYENRDISKSFYMNQSVLVNTLKDAVDYALLLNISFFVYDNIITEINQKDYKTSIQNIKFNDFITPVSFTYFDPMDIYLHPSRYTLNMGIGIMDTTQPSYTIYVSKNQLPSLVRLLKVSSHDTPVIHAFFDFPDYTVAWDDAWITQMITSYQGYKTDAFQNTLSDFLKTQGFNVTLDYKNLQNNFSILKPTFYWIITLLSLYGTVDTETLFQYMRSAGYDPKPCYDFCDRDALQCVNMVRIKQSAFDIVCNEQPKGTPQALIEECKNENQIASDNSVKECIGDKKNACRLHCLTGGSTSNKYCESNSDCSNGACGRLTADDYEPLVCCPSGKTINYFGFDYCTDIPDGSVCFIDKMCQNGNCKGNWDGLRKGLCS